MKSNNKFKKILITFLVLICIIISAFFINSMCNKKTYSITFYDNNIYIDSIILNIDKTITVDSIKEVEKKLSDYDSEKDFYYVWSVDSNVLISADFNQINYNITVYLFRIKDEYKININQSNLFEFELISENNIKYGDSVEFFIIPNVDLNNYFMEIFISGEKVDISKDNKYFIEYVTDDIDINVSIKEIAVISPIIKDIEYDGEKHFIEYEIINNLGEKLEKENVEVKYFIDGIETDGMLDIGTYDVQFTYTGEKYYLKNQLSFKFEIGKIEPIINIEERDFYYNGNYQGYTKNDIITNSNGEITLYNNLNKDVGIYDVIIKISETDYYEGKEIHISQTINKGIPIISEWPTTIEGFDGYSLESVRLIGGNSNIKGNFVWTDDNIKLEVGTKTYNLSFIPIDSQYDIISKNIFVEVITIDQALFRIKKEKENLFNQYKHILVGDVSNLPNLKTLGDNYSVTIRWLSSSTVLSINNLGCVEILQRAGSYNIELIALLTYGDVAEYLKFVFNLNISEQAEIVEIDNFDKDNNVDSEIEYRTINYDNDHITEIKDYSNFKRQEDYIKLSLNDDLLNRKFTEFTFSYITFSIFDDCTNYQMTRRNIKKNHYLFIP